MIGHKNNRTNGTNNASIPEDNEQYYLRMPLKLEVHKRCWTTLRTQWADPWTNNNFKDYGQGTQDYGTRTKHEGGGTPDFE